MIHTNNGLDDGLWSHYKLKALAESFAYTFVFNFQHFSMGQLLYSCSWKTWSTKTLMNLILDSLFSLYSYLSLYLSTAYYEISWFFIKLQS